MNDILIKGASFFFRGLTILGRFLLTFFITKKVSLELQGEYTLLTTTITLLVMVLGFDFYVYSSRELSKEENVKIFILKNQLLTHGIIFIFVSIIFVIYIYIFNNSYPLSFLLYCLAILFFEHLGQEFFRMYLILEKTLLANFILFLRTGIWALAISIWLFVDDNAGLTLDSILLYWLLSAIISVVVGFVFFPNINHFFKVNIDFEWIKKGIKIGLLMFTSTIALKIIEFSDRYLIVYFLGKKSLGIYSLFYQFYNLINVIIFTLVISFVYPKIFIATNKNDNLLIERSKKEIINKSLIIILAYGIISWIGMPYILGLIGKEELYNFQIIFFILLLGSVFLNISFAYHYVLIAREKEKILVKLTVLVAVINLIINLVLIPTIGIIGAAIGFLVSSLIICFLKKVYVNK